MIRFRRFAKYREHDARLFRSTRALARAFCTSADVPGAVAISASSFAETAYDCTSSSAIAARTTTVATALTAFASQSNHLLRVNSLTEWSDVADL